MLLHIVFFISLICSSLGFSFEKAATLIVRVPGPQSKLDNRFNYDKTMVELCLSKTIDEGPYRIVYAAAMNQSRSLKNLHEGRLVDVVATTSTPDRERELIAIPFSIHKELMGVKLFLIKKERADEFAKIQTIKDLIKFVGGQGHDWPDSSILEANGLNITTATNYEGLFKMLSSGRFDYFPRSLPEVFEEAEAHADKGIIVEPTIALVYPLSAFLFVNKANKPLADRLRRGMEIAIKDGSFEKVFLAKHGETIRKANLKGRKIFYLTNPMNITVPHDYTVPNDKDRPVN